MRNDTLPPVSASHLITGMDWVERLAITASALCLIHCLALPMIIAALPAVSDILALPESVHLWLLAFAIPAASAALISGYRHHCRLRPLALGAVGLSLMAAGALVFGERSLETPLTVAGSLSLAIGHIANWRLRHAAH